MDINDSIPLEHGDFEILRVLGQGAMGVVYEAQQASQQQRVALKTLSNGLGLTAKGVRRFTQVVEAAANLQHSNIVAVHSWGELGLTPYYVMQLVEGPSLDRVIPQLKLQQARMQAQRADQSDTAATDNDLPDWALRMFLEGGSKTVENDEDAPIPSAVPNASLATADQQLSRFEKIASNVADIADALSHAHQQGVLHLDIKPANLLLSPEGQLMISDFGLARACEQPGMTLSGQVIASASHTSPEQISGDQQVDQRSDVYALGVVLYELITLQSPFAGETREAIFAHVLHEDILPPRKLDSAIPVDLETICLKALEKDPNQRYQSAAQLSEDLRRFVTHHGIVAERMGLWRKSTRWSRRHWTLSAGMILGVLAAGGLGFVGYQQYVASQARTAEKLSRAISYATLASLSGDELATQSKLQEAQSYGAEAWLSDLLLGQLRLFSGHYALAIERLQLALAQQPGNIEVQTLLEMALTATGRREEALALQENLLTSSPESTREKTYFGSWLSRLDPQRGLAILQEAERAAQRTESTLVRLWLAQADWRLLQDSGDPAAAEMSARRARLVRELQRTNCYAWLTEFQVLRVATVVLRAAGREADADALDSQANEALGIINKLFANTHAAAKAWGWQAQVLADPEQRLQAFGQAISAHDGQQSELAGSLRYAYALELFLHERWTPASEEFKMLRDSDEPFCGVLGAILTATGEGGVAAAREELSRLPPPVGIVGLYRPLGLMVLGQAEDARLAYEQLGQTVDLPAYPDDRYQVLLEFGQGALTADAFLDKQAQPPKSKLRLNQAHFFVAMHLLSRGRRTQAQEQFEACIQTGIFASGEHQTSRAILKKWETEPDWPAWIPAWSG